MSRTLISAALLALIAAGCSDNSSDGNQAYQQSPVQGKPVVTVVPVIDSTKNSFDWNLSDELSSALYQHFAQQDRLALNPGSKVRAKTKKFAEGNNPFGADITWVKHAFQEEEFVVFLELVEHEEVLNHATKKGVDPRNCSADLKMSMRVRVVDLQGNEPRVILQEMVHDSHFIPRAFTQENFYQVSWGDETFNISPLGLAHGNFTKEIAKRVEDYILTLSKE